MRKILICFLLFISSTVLADTTFQKWYNDLRLKSAKANFETAPALVNEINVLNESLEKELRAQEASLEKTIADFEATFSFIQRVNPLNEAVKECEDEKINPNKDKVQRLREILKLSNDLLQEVKAVASPIETRVTYDRGICGVFNPHTKLVEWSGPHYQRGIAGVYNPKTQKVEWSGPHYQRGIAGVYNPKTQKVEWSGPHYQRGIAGVYNPKTQMVEWSGPHYQRGIAGVYNPKTQKVEWSGPFYNRSVAVVYKALDGTSSSSCSFSMDYDDD